MTIYEWLTDNKISIKKFTQIIGCTRGSLKKVQDGHHVSEEIAMRIRIITLNQVIPSIRDKGRPLKKL